MIPGTSTRLPEAGRFLRPGGNRRVRRERHRRILSRALLWVAAVAGGVGAAALAVAAGTHWMMTTPALSVREIRVQGAERADPAAVASLASGCLTRNLLTLDLPQVARSLRAHPWVAEVSLRKELPGTLVVRVREHEPRALAVLDGAVYLIDSAGAPIDRYGPRYAAWSLPVLRGLDGLPAAEQQRRCRRAADQLAAVEQAAPELFRRLSAADLSTASAVMLEAEDVPERILVDPSDWTRNLDEFLRLRAGLLARHGAVEYADLRWNGRVVVMPADAAQP